MRVAIVHAYSASNAGDGLLVEKSVDMVRGSLGSGTEIVVYARYPETFHDIDVQFVDTRFWRRGINLAYLRGLRALRQCDLIVGVGGGYLRFSTPVEAAKTVLAHFPQMLATKLSRRPSVYLPQSVGPFRWFPRRLMRAMLSGMSIVCLRDDRSVEELSSHNVVRTPDLALMALQRHATEGRSITRRPVLSVRTVRGSIPPGVVELAAHLSDFDGYVQSRGAGNDDVAAVAATLPTRVLSRTEFLDGGPRRVVIAVRLHAALMALDAGHWVIHLAYERKGFGAFRDLDLSEYVHNVNSFDPQLVNEQVRMLLSDSAERSRYDERVNGSKERFNMAREDLVEKMRGTLTCTDSVNGLAVARD